MLSDGSKSLLWLTVVLAILTLSVQAAVKLPPERAGQINPPTGQIAFIRDGNIWVMEANGLNPHLICEVANADGRLGWAPNGKSIVFTRAGMVDLKGPDGTGGVHKVYDLFYCYPDSAKAGKSLFWMRLTDDVGSRDPEWSADGSKIIFWKDLNSNKVNAESPNYQLATIEPDGSNVEILRKDWMNFTTEFLMSPSLNSKGDLAYVYFLAMGPKQGPAGVGVIPAAKIMTPLDSLKTQAKRLGNFVAPVWSPDGKWIALVDKTSENNGLYIATPDLKETYLVAVPPVGTYINTMPPSFSPDSKWITFSTTDGSIWCCDIAGNGLKKLASSGRDKAPAWSR